MSSTSSHVPSLLERIRALDKSAELSHQYTALIMYHPRSPNSDHSSHVASAGDSSSYVAVGHAQTSFVNSTLLNCKNEDGDPIFVKGEFTNESGVMTEVLRLHMDVQIQKDVSQSPQQGTRYHDDAYDYTKLFEQRTSAFEHVTNHLISAGVISRKHSDLYPIFPFVMPSASGGSEDYIKVVLAHINRNTAPYLGIDNVGVHLHCYVCEHEQTAGDDSCNNINNKKPPIKGLWLQKRAPTKSHHPNCWDPTAAGGQPADLSLVDNVAKEAQEEAGVPPDWILRNDSSNTTNASPDILFSDHTHDPLTITTAKPDGTCLKRSLYYSCDLQVPRDWTPIPVDGEVSEFKLYSMQEMEEELRFGNSVRPAMRAVLLDFMMRHGVLKEKQNFKELKDAMRRERLILWQQV